MDLVTTKMLVLGLMFILTLLFGTIPIFIDVFVSRYGTNLHKELVSRILGLLTFAAGGVFLGTIMIHLVPDVVDEFAEAGLKTKFPIAYFTVVVGMLMFLVLEHVMLCCLSYVNNHPDSKRVLEVLESSTRSEDCENPKSEDSEIKIYYGSMGSVGDKQDHEKTPLMENNAEEVSCVTPSSHKHSDMKLALRCYAIVVALSLHAVFDGMVIGFQSIYVSVWELFFTLIFHKVIVAFSLGSKLQKLKNILCLRHILGLVVIFSIMSPIGGAISTAMTSAGNNSNLVEAILVGLATGSFIYVTFFEMLKFDDTRMGNLLNCLFVLIGFAVIVTEIYITGGH